MKKLGLITTIVLLLCSCDTTQPPPPPPPPVCDLTPDDCSEGEAFVEEECACIPVTPPPPPPPDCQGEPSCYIHIDRVDDILNGTSTQNLGLMHWCPFTNWRDPRDVGNKCKDEVAHYLGFSSSASILSFGEVDGMELCVEGEQNIVPQLKKENRRCDADNPNYDERFLKSDGSCARSEMRKSRLIEYRARLDPHQNRAIGLRARGGECRTALMRAGGGAFDSVAGFCGALKKAEAETGFTVDDCPNQ